ncbi:hypothetical protein [Actinoplanes subglobosus]|uniref:Lipoprotein n=1 Tax=Actinoplanes subglobosus TaxID=1547892 RepID=A0ABV8ILW5_9ACTN
MRRHLALVPLLLLLAACGNQSQSNQSQGDQSQGDQSRGEQGQAQGAGSAPATAPATTSPGPAGTTPAATTKPATPAPGLTAVSGPQYAFVKSVDPATRKLTYDLVEWFEGKAAVKACADDGEKPAENDWCVGYYIRNKNTKVRTATVASGAEIRVVDLGELTKATLGKVEPDMLLRLEIDGDVISAADQIYLP